MSISPSSLNCLYAPNEVDNDEKKQDYFLNDLNDGLAYSLEARDFDNFQRMVNNALVLKNHRGVMERKRKLLHQNQSSSSSRPRVATPTAGLCSDLLSRYSSRGRWTRIFYPTASSDSAPQQFPDPCC
jgi:hypothetical protein